MRIFNKWPVVELDKITLLPWWNVYDIDSYLYNNWLINSWEYINEIKNVSKYSEKYQFLKWLETEWFLYPDTYFIDLNTFSVEQTVSRQLDYFEKKSLRLYYQIKAKMKFMK